jgi:hypothetical protein
MHLRFHVDLTVLFFIAFNEQRHSILSYSFKYIFGLKLRKIVIKISDIHQNEHGFVYLFVI